MFAAVTADAKLQIWDLAYSAIDPVINLDTNIDAEADVTAVTASKTANSNVVSAASSAPPSRSGIHSPDAGGSPGLLTSVRRTVSGAHGRRDDHDREDGERERETPVSKLLRSLALAGARRSLTCVLFGERSPIVVVGDNRGAVSVYRVTNPVLQTHEGPLQQAQKLRDAVLRQSDPLEAAKLSSNSNVAESITGTNTNPSTGAGITSTGA